MANSFGTTAVSSINVNSDGAITHFKSSTYTATGTGVANVTGTPTASGMYVREGDNVTVYLNVSCAPTAGSTLTQVGVSLPIASNIGTLYGCAVHQSGSTLIPGMFTGDTTNDRAELRFTSSGTGTHIFRGSFMYIVA